MATGERYSSERNLRLVMAALADGNTDPDCLTRRNFRTNPFKSISKLGDDLLGEILIRLPNPRSASRCKPVCKRWNSLLSSPIFNRRFVSHHQSRNVADGEPPLLFLLDDGLLPPILCFLPVPEEIRSKFIIWDSFKDLVLCGFCAWWREGDDELGRLFLVCNPFTKQWVALPLAPQTTAGRYLTTEVKLVCEEEARKPHHSLDLGDGQVLMFSDYRFRVLRGYSSEEGDLELHSFCSKSRKWSRTRDFRLRSFAVFLNGKLYWNRGQIIECFDPFRLDIPPTIINDMQFFRRRFRVSRLSTSQGTMYIIGLESQHGDDGLHSADRNWDVFRVWRWEEGNMRWTECHEMLFKTLKYNSGPDMKDLQIGSVLAQHPDKPEIFFLKCYRKQTAKKPIVCSCNFRRGKFEFIDDQLPDNIQHRVLLHWMVFQPRTTCFSTLIPNYEKLLHMYNGNYGSLVQRIKSS